jgi:anti-sigma regulatory factor (Ser/Thr protein kinase)
VDIHTRYPGVPADVRATRHLIADQLDGLVSRTTTELAILLTSEIVTNVVLHTGSTFVLRLTLRPDAIRIAVHDHSAHLPHMRKPTLGEVHGRGLHIVNAFASRWGYETNGNGKSVWFELDR